MNAPIRGHQRPPAYNYLYYLPVNRKTSTNVSTEGFVDNSNTGAPRRRDDEGKSFAEIATLSRSPPSTALRRLREARTARPLRPTPPGSLYAPHTGSQRLIATSAPQAGAYTTRAEDRLMASPSSSPSSPGRVRSSRSRTATAGWARTSLAQNSANAAERAYSTRAPAGGDLGARCGARGTYFARADCSPDAYSARGGSVMEPAGQVTASIPRGFLAEPRPRVRTPLAPLPQPGSGPMRELRTHERPSPRSSARTSLALQGGSSPNGAYSVRGGADCAYSTRALGPQLVMYRLVLTGDTGVGPG